MSNFEMLEDMLVTLADRYRYNWSEFDGRTLRSEIHDAIDIAINEDSNRANEFISEQKELIGV